MILLATVELYRAMRAPDRIVLDVVKSCCLGPTYCTCDFMANYGNLLNTALVAFCSYRYVALWVCCSPGIQPIHTHTTLRAVTTCYATAKIIKFLRETLPQTEFEFDGKIPKNQIFTK